MLKCKTHGSVSCSPKGVQQTSVYFTGVKKMPFHASTVCSTLSKQFFSVQISLGWDTRHEAIMLQKLSIMLLSSAPKITYYAFKNAHYSQNHATNFGQ